MRIIYTIRLLCRILIFAVCIWVVRYRQSLLHVLRGDAFFRSFTLLHILWAVWILDMLPQLIPTRHRTVAMGSVKHFALFYRPQCPHQTDLAIDMKEYSRRGAERLSSCMESMKKSTRAAAPIAWIWVILTIVLGILRRHGWINDSIIFLTAVFFYVCDLICVLIWCPFRLMMGNRCCTTCRIFNWDHMMMFLPLICIRGFYTWSLVLMALVVFVVWEYSASSHPERFTEETNAALSCGSCTDHLCPYKMR